MEEGQSGEVQANRQEPEGQQPAYRSEEGEPLAQAPAQEAGAQSAEQQSCSEAGAESAELHQSCSEGGAQSREPHQSCSDEAGAASGSLRSSAGGAREAEKPTEGPAKAVCSLSLLVGEDGRVGVDITCNESQPPRLTDCSTQGSLGTGNLLQQVTHTIATSEGDQSGVPSVVTASSPASIHDAPQRLQPQDTGLSSGQEQSDQLASLQATRQRLLEENALLQRAARAYIDAGSKATKQSMADASNMAGIEQRYMLGLQQLQRLMGQRAAADARVQKALAPEKEKLAVAQAHMEAHRQSFLTFIVQAAEAAKRGATGPGKAAHLNEGFQVLEPPKAAEVQALRLKNADLQHEIERIERKLKDSDRLSDGLHLIDFEQLKIENSTLSYKTEALSSEVQKLRGKLMQTIQMAAHSKEKLHCVSEEKRCLEERLQATEEQLTRARLELAAAKARREALQGTRANLRKDWDRITDGRCLEDMKAQDLKLAELQAERDWLQRTYNALAASALRK